MRLLINLCAQDGIVSHNSGVGTMVKRYIQVLEKILNAKQFEYRINLITPEYNENGFGFSAETKKQNENIKNAKIFEVSNGTGGAKFFGTHENWVKLCRNTSKIINNTDFNDFDKVITLLNDTPFAGVMFLCKYHPKHKLIWMPHSTVKIHSAGLVDQASKDFQQRLAWEMKAAKHINAHKNCFLGAVGKFIKTHMRNEYGIKRNKILDIFNGEILSQDTKYEEDEKSKLLFSEMDKSNNIMLSFGRPEKYKNLDATIKLAQHMHIKCVIITQEYYPNMPYVNFLKQLSSASNTDLYINVPFHFPQYILNHFPNKIVFVIPSTREVSELEINEIRKLGKSNILLVANNIDGLREQIDDGLNGIVIDIDDVENSSAKILKFFNKKSMQTLAQNSVIKLKEEFDLEKNITRFLGKLLKSQI